MSGTLDVRRVAESDHARVASARIGGKTVELPGYVPKLRSEQDFKVLVEQVRAKGKFGGIAVDAQVASKVVKSGSFRQTTLVGAAETSFRELAEVVPIYIDPRPEFAYYQLNDARQAYLRIRNLPNGWARMLNAANPKNFQRMWAQLWNSGEYDHVAAWNVRLQSSLGADVIIPIVPIVEDDNRILLQMACDANAKSASVAEAFLKPPALYFLMNFTAFKKTNVTNGIINFISSDKRVPETAQTVFVKIKNHDHFDTGGAAVARRNLRDFIVGCSSAVREREGVLIVIDSGSLGFALCVGGADGFIEPIDGRTRDHVAGPGASPYGNYYHPDLMTFIAFDDACTFYENNGSVLPESKYVVRTLGSRSPRGLDSETWNRFRRAHLIGCRVEELEELRDSIRSNSVRDACQRIARSANKSHLEVVPEAY